MRTRKSISFIMLFIFISVLMPLLNIYAADETISKADIHAELFEDGSALITQTLNIENLNDGTEYYMYIMKRENLHINFLEVWDESGQVYELQDTWNTDRSLEEKAYTCGILDAGDRYELCWGLGSYGDHTYTIRYRVEGFVQSYEDEAGFYYQFFSSEQAAGMEDVNITIVMENISFSLDNARIWGIGFDSYIDFDVDGGIYAYNEAVLGDDQTVRIMCSFRSDMFPYAPSGSGTFERVRERGLNGGNPEDKDVNFTRLFIILGIIAVVIGGIIYIIYSIYSRVKLDNGTILKRPKWKNAEPRSTLPFEGNLPAACYSLKTVYRALADGSIFGAYLIKWENDGMLHMEDQNEGKKKKAKTMIIFSQDEPSYPDYEMKLYQTIKKRADANGKLTQKSFQNWADKHYKTIVKWEQKLIENGEHWLMDNNYRSIDVKGKGRFTQRGYDQLAALQGLHRYLKEYKQHYASGEIHTELWGDYLIYAILLGLDEQLIVDLRESNPVYFDEFSYRYGYHDTHDIACLLIMANLMSSGTVSHAQSVSAMDGGGGSSSIGGGGGFSGGGGGVR